MLHAWPEFCHFTPPPPSILFARAVEQSLRDAMEKWPAKPKPKDEKDASRTIHPV